MKKTFALWVAVLLCFGVTSVSAAPRFPAKTASGIVTDNASVLSHEMIDALNDFSKLLKDKDQIRLNVVTVHFLDGEDVRIYAKELFERWNLGTEDLLLLLAIGEDKAYTAAGAHAASKLSEDTRVQLLTEAFYSRLDTRDIDGAMQVYVQELHGKRVPNTPLTGLFADVGYTANPRPVTVSDNGHDNGESAGMPSLQENLADQLRDNLRTVESTLSQIDRRWGVNAGQLLLLAIIFLLIFNPRRHARKWGRAAGCSTCGCGCAPLSWLFALLGVREAVRK